MTHLSLFSGIGGLDLAAEMAGFKTVGQVEIDDYCNRVLEYHWPDVPRWRDVKDVTAETFEQKTGIKPGTLALLSGGFPCQPFSTAGKRKGKADSRFLWPEMLRVICEIRPRWIVAENVRGILSIDTGRTFGRILSDLAKNGYRVGWLCYGAGDVGAPHRRERVFIVAHTPQHLLNRPRQARQAGRGEFADGGAGPTQPRLGDFADGLPAGLAGHRWPAGPGPQHPWEPPRIAARVKDRVAKLKALGNAVVPAQAYPIFRAIMEIERRASLSYVEVKK